MHTKRTLASHIDHTLLKPDASPDQVEALCAEAKKYSFHSVCVNPFYVPMCSMMTSGSSVKVCTVIGFPLGANMRGVKAMEADYAVADGAHELDMVLNISALKARDHRYIEAEIKEVRKAAGNTVLKVIIEAGMLEDEEKKLACKICASSGADFIKTSTGFFGGATAKDVSFLVKNSGGLICVKASGGIKTLSDALLMMDCGASRLGTSASVAIIKELE